MWEVKITQGPNVACFGNFEQGVSQSINTLMVIFLWLIKRAFEIPSCRTATLDFFFDLAESKVAVFLCSILTSDGIPFCFGKNSFL